MDPKMLKRELPCKWQQSKKNKQKSLKRKLNSQKNQDQDVNQEVCSKSHHDPSVEVNSEKNQDGDVKQEVCSKSHHDPSVEVNSEIDRSLPATTSVVGIWHSDMQIPDYENYADLLLRVKAFSGLGEWPYFEFVLQNYDAKRRTIKAKYIFLKRRVIAFCDKVSWVYSCTCCNERQQYVLSLDSEIEKSYDEVIVVSECIHIKALTIVQAHLDPLLRSTPEEIHEIERICKEHNYADYPERMCQQTKVLTSHVPGGMDKVAIFSPSTGTWGVCHVIYTKSSTPQGKVRCSICHTYLCAHCQDLQGLMKGCTDEESPVQAFKEELELEPTMREYRQLTSMSCFKIPVFPTKQEKSGNKVTIVMVPSLSGQCPKCNSSWMGQQIPPDDWTAFEMCKVYNMSSTYAAPVYFRPCSDIDCTEKKMYDGLEHQILCFGRFAFSHDVMYDYMHHFFTEGLPMYTYYKNFMHHQIIAENHDIDLPYGHFRLGCLAFFRLLDMDIESGFSCSTCGLSPDKVVMDGKCFGPQKTFMPLNISLKSEKKSTRLNGSRFEMRNFIPSKATRTRLRNYCKSILTLQDFEILFDQIQKASSTPSLIPFMEEMCRVGNINKCPDPYNSFIYALAQDTPVSSLITNDEATYTLLQKMSEGYNPRSNPEIHMRHLQEHAPFIFKLCSLSETIPSFICPMFSVIVEKSKASFTSSSNNNSHILPPAYHSNNSSSFYPCLPQLVERGSYIGDSHRITSELSVNPCDKKPQARKRCQSLMPGIFTINCPHGVCYGFEIMRDFESPNIPFTLLRTRFQKAPSTVVYDNACNLHQYCLNRDPLFFMNTKFLVDRFHWKNHKGCSEGYNISCYPQHSTLNSQVAEQRNATLNTLGGMGSYMDLENFMRFTRTHMWFYNMLHLNKNPTSNTQYSKSFKSLVKVYCK